MQTHIQLWEIVCQTQLRRPLPAIRSTLSAAVPLQALALLLHLLMVNRHRNSPLPVPLLMVEIGLL